MACCSLCLYLLIIFFRISLVLPSNDFHFYKTDSYHSSEHHIELKALENENEHVLQKRDATELEVDHPTSLNVTAGQNGTIEEPSIPPPKKKSGKIQKNLYPLSTMQPTVNISFANGSIANVTDQKNLTFPVLLNHTIYMTKNKNVQNDSELSNSKLSDNEDDEQYIDPDTEEDYDKLAAKHNISQVKTDTHIYYNSSLENNPEVGQLFWVDMANRSDVIVNKLLSQSHRRAATVKLSFEFPFYGQLIKNVTIATGGFLYTGDYVHSWLAATQYIAPLMANFDTSLSNTSFIKYVDNGTAFTVEWEKVNLQEKPSDGEFTFQVTLHRNGDIIFVYKNVPLYVKDIQDVNHPVKVGLSDAYIMDRTVFFVRKKTIYEYHRVDFKKEDIRNWTVIYLTPLQTCLDSTDCVTCLSRSISFPCMWCPSVNKCSTGIDRNRQDWLAQDCNRKRIENETMCSHINSTNSVDFNYNSVDSFDHSSTASRVYAKAINKPEQVGISGILAIIFLLTMVAGLAFWVFYAYRNPHTTSGQILIKYRPTQWRWRRGEARYTAATIHM